MTQRKPAYCPYCGAKLVPKAFEERERTFCPDYDEFIFQNPVPVARVVVLDGESALFVKRGRPPFKDMWTIPGGVLEVDEPAPVGATRELEEETRVHASADDLDVVWTDLRVKGPDDGSILTICFCVERSRTGGTPQVGDEPTSVRFWHPEELLESNEQARSLDIRCVESSIKRIRGEPAQFLSEE